MNRIVEQLLGKEANIFSTQDICACIETTDFARDGLLKRAIARGEIVKVRRGLYVLGEKFRRAKPSVYALAERIYGPSYVSMESALSYCGWIPEAVYVCANASFKKSREFETPLGKFSYKRIPQNNFMSCVKRVADGDGNVFFMASPAKALCDILYACKPAWRTIDEASESLRIETGEIDGTRAEELNLLLSNYRSSRVEKFLKNWIERIEK